MVQALNTLELDIKAMPVKKQLPPLVTIPQACEFLGGISRQAVWEAIKDERLKAQTFGHVRLIERDSLAEYARNRKPAPRRPRRSKKNSARKPHK